MLSAVIQRKMLSYKKISPTNENENSVTTELKSKLREKKSVAVTVLKSKLLRLIEAVKKELDCEVSKCLK